MSLLDIRNLHVAYRGAPALENVSLTVAPGEIVGLIGESGSGKSTLALAAMGLLPEDAAVTGTILLDGAEPAALPERARDALRGGVAGMIFQEPATALNPAMTIGAQVAETIRLHRRTGRREAARQAAATLARVGLDPGRIPPTRYSHQLSGGQRQRVAIAIAIASGPKLLIADEPTTALDVTTQAEVLALLRALVAGTGMGLLFVSHDLAVVAGIADRIVVMRHGAIVEQGPVRDVLHSPQASYARTLVKRARHVPRRRSTPQAEAVLEVDGLIRTHPGSRSGLRRARPFRAVDDVSFTVRRGETLGIVGESGSGKTTLLRAVLGLDAIQAGSVRLAGQRLDDARGPARRAWRRQVQAVFQDPVASFDPRHSVERIVAEPLHLRDVPPGRDERRHLIETALTQVGLDPAFADRLPHRLSGGQRQRVAIARALVIEPSLIVLDEAVSALDVSIRADILDLLAALSDGLGVSYLFVSHDLGVMRAVADRLLVMQAGRIVERGETLALMADPHHPYTRALIAATPDLDRELALRHA